MHAARESNYANEAAAGCGLQLCEKAKDSSAGFFAMRIQRGRVHFVPLFQ